MGVRNCFVKVNSDAAYRAKFIKDPVGVLRSEGIELSAKDQKELVEVVGAIRKSLPKLGRLPTGYEVVVSKVSEEGHKKRDVENFLI